MDRDRDTGQYLSCHRERRRKLASSKGLGQLSKSNQGMGSDPSGPKPFAQSSRMVSDFTLTRQRENIARLEVVSSIDFSLWLAEIELRCITD